MSLGEWYVQLNFPGFLMLTVVVALWFLIFLLPVIVIVRRTGHSGWWALLMFAPILNIIGLQLLAHGRWPALDSRI